MLFTLLFNEKNNWICLFFFFFILCIKSRFIFDNKFQVSGPSTVNAVRGSQKYLSFLKRITFCNTFLLLAIVPISTEEWALCFDCIITGFKPRNWEIIVELDFSNGTHVRTHERKMTCHQPSSKSILSSLDVVIEICLCLIDRKSIADNRMFALFVYSFIRDRFHQC